MENYALIELIDSLLQSNQYLCDCETNLSKLHLVPIEVQKVCAVIAGVVHLVVKNLEGEWQETAVPLGHLFIGDNQLYVTVNAYKKGLL